MSQHKRDGDELSQKPESTGAESAIPGGAEPTSVGDAISAGNAAWTFKGNVHKTFDDHVSRSVPLYAEGHDLVAKVSDYFLGESSLCYELGCSTGSLLCRLAERSKGKGARFVGIDSVRGMVQEASAKCVSSPEVKVVQGDVTDFDFGPADLFISYYTIQFIRPSQRQELFNRIYESLNWGGGFLLFEKVRAPDARFQDMMSGLYTDFKLDQGFSEAEIVNKTRSLKGVLEPFSTAGNLGMLERAGFVDVMSVFKYVCFEGFLAIK